jgi:putative protease
MKNWQHSIELLSPAGSFEKMLFAFEYGADAVYAGAKSFSLREGAANFSLEELAKAVDIAHSRGKKFYLTSNVFFHNSHLKQFKDFLKELVPIPIDGLIVSDLGAITYIREKYPQIPIHVSTQANTTNSEAVRFYEKLGVFRIVLARELTLEEIKVIRDATSLELETFIHGAMCISYSGRCLLSNYFTNLSLYKKGEKIGNMKRLKTRDANLGDCAQSCRWEYYLVEATRKNDFIPIVEEDFGTAILSSKDLNLSAHIKELIDAGVNSFKIEGRMKSAYYAGNVSRVYRYAIDCALANQAPDLERLDELNKISHREYTTGFYLGENQALAAPKTNQYLRDYIFLGYVLEVLDKNSALVQAMNQIKPGSELEIVMPGFQDFVLKNYQLFKEEQAAQIIQPNEQFVLKWDGPEELVKYAILRRKI